MRLIVKELLKSVLNYRQKLNWVSAFLDHFVYPSTPPPANS